MHTAKWRLKKCVENVAGLPFHTATRIMDGASNSLKRFGVVIQVEILWFRLLDYLWPLAMVFTIL